MRREFIIIFNNSVTPQSDMYLEKHVPIFTENVPTLTGPHDFNLCLSVRNERVWRFAYCSQNYLKITFVQTVLRRPDISASV